MEASQVTLEQCTDVITAVLLTAFAVGFAAVVAFLAGGLVVETWDAWWDRRNR